MYCDGCHISLHFKKVYQIGEFLYSCFNIEDGSKKHYWDIMLYYFNKGKNATKTQKKTCTAYGEGAVTDQMHQKWLQSFLLQISHWTVPHSQVGQLKLTAIKLSTINMKNGSGEAKRRKLERSYDINSVHV